MDIQPQTTKPISDDQELAKVLAGVSNDSNDMSFEETPVTQIPVNNPVVESTSEVIDEPKASIDDAPIVINMSSNNIDAIKKDALIELKPLVDKLELSPEEKFDIYLLLIRSTDDITLIDPAHRTAQTITDESKRAQALLDIIKEIDYLSNPPQVAK